MIVRHHEPLGNPAEKQHPLPDNWRELAEKSGDMPRKFGVVEKDRLYRSAIIWPHQVKRLHNDYGITNIITLLDGDWLEQFYSSDAITIHQFPFFQRRELTLERVKNIVDVINAQDEPSIVCCWKGLTRTGMVVAGYEILNERKSNLRAIAESLIYGNLNISSFREIRNYR